MTPTFLATRSYTKVFKRTPCFFMCLAVCRQCLTKPASKESRHSSIIDRVVRWQALHSNSCTTHSYRYDEYQQQIKLYSTVWVAREIRAVLKGARVVSGWYSDRTRGAQIHPSIHPYGSILSTPSVPHCQFSVSVSALFFRVASSCVCFQPPLCSDLTDK